MALSRRRILTVAHPKALLEELLAEERVFAFAVFLQLGLDRIRAAEAQMVSCRPLVVGFNWLWLANVGFARASCGVGSLRLVCSINSGDLLAERSVSEK